MTQAQIITIALQIAFRCKREGKPVEKAIEEARHELYRDYTAETQEAANRAIRNVYPVSKPADDGMGIFTGFGETIAETTEEKPGVFDDYTGPDKPAVQLAQDEVRIVLQEPDKYTKTQVQDIATKAGIVVKKSWTKGKMLEAMRASLVSKAA